MRNIFKVLIIMATLFSSSQVVAGGLSGEEKIAKLSLIKSAIMTNVAAETIASSYLYIGEKIGARQAKKELQNAINRFNKNYKVLSESINDPKIKNLLQFVKMSYDELADVLKEPYSLDNAQIVLDLVGTISEGARHIANVYKKEIGYKGKIIKDGIIPMVESISKYYIAYQAGIRDENTINLMKKTVEGCDKKIKHRLNYPKNTVQMNQTINKVNQLWQIVNKFYLDIDKGGLPFIVFKTTSKLKKEIKDYNKMYIKLETTRLKAGK